MPETKPDPYADYRKHVGNSFSNGVVNATVKAFHPDTLIASKRVPSFLINEGHEFISRFVDADKFLAEYTAVTGDQKEQ